MSFFGSGKGFDVDDNTKEAAKQLLVEGSLVEEYVKWASSKIPYVDVFHELAVLTAIGHVANHVRVPYTARKTPRLFTLILARTREGKSAAINVARASIWASLNTLDLMSGSLEGHLEELALEVTPPLIISEELAILLGPEYARNILDLFIRAYDMKEWIHRTRDKNRRIRIPPDKMRLSAYLASQPSRLTAKLNTLDVASGFLPRFVIAHIHLSKDLKRRQLRERADEFPEIIRRGNRIVFTDNTAAIFAYAISELKNTLRRAERAVFAKRDVREHYISVCEELLDYTDTLPENVSDILKSADEHVITIAAIKAISRVISEPNLKPRIRAEDIDYALDVIRKTTLSSVEVITDIIQEPRHWKDKIEETADLILAILSENPEGRMSRRDVLKRLRSRKAYIPDAENLLKKLEKLATVHAPTGGRRSVLYCIPEDEKCEKCELRKYCSYAIQNISP